MRDRAEAEAAARSEPAAAAGQDRRQGDRRRNDRRRRAEPAQAWPSHLDGLLDGATGNRRAASGTDEPVGAALGSAGAGPDEGAQARVFRTYLAARIATGLGLLAVQALLLGLGQRASPAVMAVCLAYAAQALTLWWWPGLASGPFTAGSGSAAQRRRWLATIGVDLLAFATLHLLQLSASFSFAALLVLPVLMGGVTMSRLPALAIAAGVTLLLLFAAWRSTLAGVETTVVVMQSGLAGLGLFVIALLAGELAARLAREEQSARGSLELARQQAQLNRMVIEEMADGVLVVDPSMGVRAANPAARALLVAQGLSPPAPFSLLDQPAWHALSAALTAGLQGQGPGEWPEEGRDITLRFDAGFSRTLRLRARYLRSRDGSGELGATTWAVLLLEDLRTAQARIRQEKLAAMGRVSAGIAHEIRNPLAAIAQANALLQEDLQASTHQRLTGIVAQNVARLKRLVDDVMEVAPGAAAARRVIDASREVAAASADWAVTAGLPLGHDSRLRVQLPATALGVVFDPEHLRRVLVNLLDNAHRHASPGPGSIRLTLAALDEFSAHIVVSSDSAAIPPDVERHLFEPFFSTRSRGSGLGLYICRELCERYGASIEYRPRGEGLQARNEFVVTLRRAASTDGEPLLPLET